MSGEPPNVTARPSRITDDPLPWERRNRPTRSGERALAGRARRTRRRELARERREAEQADYSPARGDRRKHSGRVLLPMRLPVHRATTANLQAIYPFIVETGLGSDGVYIGREAGSGASFVYDPWHLYQQQVITNANILLAGVLGRGKSALAKTLAYRLAAFGVRTYVPGDPKGEWGVVARALGVEPLQLGRGLPTRNQPARRRLQTGRHRRRRLAQRDPFAPDHLVAGTHGDRARSQAHAGGTQRALSRARRRSHEPTRARPGRPSRCCHRSSMS